MIKRTTLLVLSLVLILTFTVTATELKQAQVVRVIDGDTIGVNLQEGGNYKVKYIGIETSNNKARDYNKALVENKTVWLELGEKERDQDDRLLAYVYLDKAKKSMVNAILLAQGYAKALTNSSSVGRASNETVIYFFKMKGCPHCATEEPFLEELQQKYPSLVVVNKEVSDNQENLELLKEMGEEYGREIRGVPATFIGEDVWVGFTEKIGNQIEEKAKGCSENRCINPMVKLKGESKGENYKFAETFEELARDARKDKRGLWSEDAENDDSEEVGGVNECIEALNNATQEDFEAMSGIGEGIAKRLIDAQPFESCDDVGCIKANLTDVSYVGEVRSEDILKHFCLELVE